ncbi:cobalt-precorrin-6A reductase [Kribbella sp. NPDC004875]|uniref:cobalt-precorrin-6A reductase n=1 Tax=Kribbella sp. NPDC004875 TaxID=3364107 RepID=UPI00369C1425
MRVLLLGGTGEARELAKLLVAEGIEVLSSLAGRTAAAVHPVGDVRVGGFGGVDGLIAWLRVHPVDAVVDATHPFAAQMTANAAAAAARTGVPLVVLRRAGWNASVGDDWRWVDTASAAAELLPALGSRVFLTIGRQGLADFADTGLWTLARCVDAPQPLPTWCTLVLARGPFAVEHELALLRRHQIDVLVTKDSGGPATAAKLAAASELSLPVVVIRRPELPRGPEVVESVAEAAQWVMRLSHSPST